MYLFLLSCSRSSLLHQFLSSCSQSQAALQLWCMGNSPSWPPLPQSMGSRAVGSRAQVQLDVVHRPSGSAV